MKRIFLMLFILLIFSINIIAIEYRSHYEIISSAGNNVDFKVKPEVRYDITNNNHYYTHFDIGFDWAINNWFVFSPYYRHVNEVRNNNWQIEYRPHLNAKFRMKITELSLSNAHRIEFRIRESGTSFRYINKSIIKFPKFTKFNIQPYIAEEFFYDINAKILNKNRIYSGIDFNIIGNISAGIVYVFESAISQGNLVHLNIIGTSLKYNL